jgi:hypothetical protein
LFGIPPNARSRKDQIMSYQKDREDFIATFSAQSTIQPPHHAADIARLLLRNASTLQRLAVAQCNGDYPCDNGERKVIPCPRCEQGVVPSDIKRGLCGDCRAQDRVTALLAETPYQPYFQGDPRGAVLRLFARGTSHDDMYCGRVHGLYVPAKG